MSPDRDPDLAVITGDLAPNLSEDGRAVATALSERGIDSRPVRWDDPSVEWNSYDCALFRSCWDYPGDVPRFRDLLDELDAAQIRVCNPLKSVRWNLHKGYLRSLRDAGVRIPATTVIERGADASLDAVLGQAGWTEAVVKPAVGAMSTDVWRVSAPVAGESERRFADLLTEGDALVQQFVPEIADGERSIVFFGGNYSHAWNSLLEPGEITEFDGIDAEYAPSEHVRDQAESAVRAACADIGRRDLPYARVDYVERESDLLLMELELIEPYLGLDRGEGAVERFADTLVEYFGGSG